jgi:hypothetical protein
MRRAALSTLVLALVVFACDRGSGGSSCEPLIENTAALGADQGLLFLDGRVLSGQDGRSTDLVAFVSGDSLDLKSRLRAGTTDRLPLHWFRDAGGGAIVYASLYDVPDQAPTSDDVNLFVNHPQAGYGFTVATPDSSSFARVWIEAVSSASVTLQYQLHVTCE